MVLQVLAHHLLTPLTLVHFLHVLHPMITQPQPPTRHNSPPKTASPSHGKAECERDVACLRWDLPPVRPGGSSCLLGQPKSVTLSPRSVPRPNQMLWRAKRRLVSREPCLGALC